MARMKRPLHRLCSLAGDPALPVKPLRLRFPHARSGSYAPQTPRPPEAPLARLAGVARSRYGRSLGEKGGLSLEVIRKDQLLLQAIWIFIC